MKDLDEIVATLVNSAQENEIIVVMSQGAFGGIQHKIATKLDKKWQ